MRIHNITNLKDFLQLQHVWNSVVTTSSFNNIFLSYQWFAAWWRNLSGQHTLEVLLMREGEAVVGIAPLMRKDDCLYFMASKEVTDYCDFIFPQEKYQYYLGKMLNFVQTHYSGIIRWKLINLPAEAAALKYLPVLAAENRYSCSSFACETTSSMSLPPTYKEYLASLSRKYRHELRRKIKRMDSLTGIRISKITQINDLRFAMDDFISLHKASHPEKAEFWENPGMADFFKHLTRLFSQNGWVELCLLYKTHTLLAGLLSFMNQDRIYFYNAAYAPEYAAYSPGIYLFHHKIQQAIAQKTKIADFLRGEEKYKFDFGAKKNTIHDLELYYGESGK